MLTELRFTNFKAFGETQRIPIKPLTMIFGANSSGKSSIIHSLLLANHAQKTGSFDAHCPGLAGNMVDLGGFRNFVHRQNAESLLSLSFETAVDRRSLGTYLDGHAEERSPFLQLDRFKLSFCVAGDPPVVHRINAEIDGVAALAFTPLGNGRFRAAMEEPSVALFKRAIEGILEYSSTSGVPTDYLLGTYAQEELDRRRQARKEKVRQIREQFRRGELPTEAERVAVAQALARVVAEREFSFTKLAVRDNGPDGKGHERFEWDGFESEGLVGFFNMIGEEGSDVHARAVQNNVARIVEFCSQAIASDVARMSYLGPLRCVPDRHALAAREHDPSWLASGGQAWDLLREKAEIQEKVNGWLGERRLHTNYRVLIRRLVEADRLEDGIVGMELMFEEARSKARLSHRDLGNGIAQMLPILVTAAATEKRLIAVEQPEVHLHPALQAELGDVFIESALGERKNTFLLETHSEHLILRILRRIRETTEGKDTGLSPVQPKDVSVLYVQPGPKGAEVIELPVTPDGDFDRPWPGGFFAERFQELP